MSEIQNNELFERDAETNALVPVVASALQDGDVPEVRNGRLYKRDAETNALIPVVAMQGGDSSGGAVTVSPADKILSVEDDGLRAQIGIKKVSGGNLTTQTGLNGSDLMLASRADLLNVTSLKFSGQVTGYANGQSNLVVLFCQPDDDYNYTSHGLQEYSTGGSIDVTFSGVELIGTLKNALTWMPALQEFKIKLAVESAAGGFDGTAAVAGGTLVVENGEKLLVTGRYGEALESVEIEKKTVKVPVMGTTVLQTFIKNSHAPTSTTFFPADGAMASQAVKSGSWVNVTQYCFLYVVRISPGPGGGMCEDIELQRNGAVKAIATNQNMESAPWSDVGGWVHLLKPGDKIRCTVHNFSGASQTYTKSAAWTNIELLNVDFVDIPV
jgi:hypothetical protein